MMRTTSYATGAPNRLLRLSTASESSYYEMASFCPLPLWARTGRFSGRPRGDAANMAAPSSNAAKHSWAGFSLHVAIRSVNVRIFAERKATYLPTV